MCATQQEQFRLGRKSRNRFGIVSYERIGELAAMHGDQALTAFIDSRIRDGVGADYPTHRPPDRPQPVVEVARACASCG
jgi:hypothetical protein